MCNKTSATTAPSRMQTRSMIKNQTRASLKPARRTRTKIRKPKFLSLLKLEVSPEKTTQTQDTHRKKQLNLFPLHPENLVRERDAHAHEDDDVAFLLDSSDGSATLNGLLDNGGEGVDTPTTTATGVSSEDLTSSYAYRDQDCATTSLLRTAMKGKERDVETTEEKWVCYSEVTSCAADVGGETTTQRRLGLLSLKLDYEEIMNAWSDKGSLYLQGESSSQIVPDVHDELFPHENGNVPMDGWGSAGNVWRVPEISENWKVKGEMGRSEGLKMGQREASVLRYKEKRQNRLFSKRIRYEVRKLNAEKRPRIKGRFVKRS